ncbi:hypothetical protein [Streptomyces sp. NPDC097610]|uniref:hypothetical protein n=1 Tax=Streptomyces sp. NPDC097610 TaxID=3157227 RepID=UPI0033181F1B
MDIEEQIAASRAWEPGDPGPRPYDPDSASVMRTAAVLEHVVRIVRESPEASAHLHAGSDPGRYLSKTESSAGRERLRLQFAEDPGLVLWLQSTTAGQEALARVELEYALDPPDADVAETAIRTAPSLQVAEARRHWFDQRVLDYAQWQAEASSPRRTAGRERTRVAMLNAFTQAQGQDRPVPDSGR